MPEKMRILYGEDDESWIILTTNLLERNGFEVEIARDGDEVMKKYVENTPDLLLLDLEMPGMDVLDLVVNMNAMGTPVVVYSVHTRSQKSRSVIHMGLNDFFEKGSCESLFIERLTYHIRHKRENIKTPNIYYLSKHTLYDRTGGVVRINNEDIFLRPLDNALLRFLVSRLNMWVSKEHLCIAMWGDQEGKELKKYVTHVRNCLSADNELKILNRQGGWYCLANSEYDEKKSFLVEQLREKKEGKIKTSADSIII